MMKMPRILIAGLSAASLMIAGCAPLLGTLLTGSTAPPQAPAKVLVISRTALDFALNSFDAALYGLDFAMDSGKIVPGSPKAKQIAAVGRKVMNFLGAAEAARDLASADSYEEAFGKANEALKEFRALLGQGSTAGLGEAMPLAPGERSLILDRLHA